MSISWVPCENCGSRYGRPAFAELDRGDGVREAWCFQCIAEAPPLDLSSLRIYESSTTDTDFPEAVGEDRSSSAHPSVTDQRNGLDAT